MYLLWNRFKYVLSPQFDVYEVVSKIVRDKVADIGFGTGFGVHLFDVNAKEVYGYEVDEGAIKFARAIFPFKNLHFEYGDITNGIPGQSFDYVTMIDVLEHIEQSMVALENAKTMLKKGGTFIISTPNRLSRYRKSENHVLEYSPRELEGMLKGVFMNVSLKDYRLEPLASEYANPLIAVCRNN
jgi:2-polyprenyl-3-methyl-5-hydroxy-6-metoxy-1,4-benzoquinol methylase